RGEDEELVLVARRQVHRRRSGSIAVRSTARAVPEADTGADHTGRLGARPGADQVDQTRGAVAARPQASGRHARQIRCSSSIAGSTRSPSARTTITPGCGEVAPVVAASGWAAAAERAA